MTDTRVWTISKGQDHRLDKYTEIEGPDCRDVRVLAVPEIGSARDPYPALPSSQAEWEVHVAFYRLTVAQRDRAWREIESLNVNSTRQETEVANTGWDLVKAPRLREMAGLADDINNSSAEVVDALNEYEGASDLTGEEATDARNDAREAFASAVGDLLATDAQLRELVQKFDLETGA